MPLRYLTAGESHGKTLIGILEGIPAGMELGVGDLLPDLARRKLGYGRGNRQKIESDKVEILCGVRHGKTLGSPVALAIANADFKNWEKIMAVEPVAGEIPRRVEIPRPGHADLAGALKYGFDDMRNVLERSSARETAMRVALGAVARKFLRACGIAVASRVTALGAAASREALPCAVSALNALADRSPMRTTDGAAEKKMLAEVDKAKARGDTLGGVFEVYAEGQPVGLGSYAQWDRRLEGPLTAAVMSLNAVKGVEVGMGFEAARRPGSQVHDEFIPAGGRIGYKSNRSGGIDGGMSTGQPILVRAAMKPLSTLMKPLDSVNLKTREAAKAHIERSDVCAVAAAAVIAESLVALVLADAVLIKFGGDSMPEILTRVKAWHP